MSNQPFGLPELVAALRARIEADTDLLAKVAQYATNAPQQPLDTLSKLVAVEDVEGATGGKIKTGQLRWLARNRFENGLADAFVKIGRKLYLNVPKFNIWLASQEGGNV